MNIDPKTLTGTWNYPTAMRFGPGRIGELADACESLAMTRPLLVTDPGLAAFDMVTAAVAASGASLFSEIKGNPVGRNEIGRAHV